MWRSGCRTTAAATPGPARQPRPTSSTPATWQKPTRRSAFSSVRMAGTRMVEPPIDGLALGVRLLVLVAAAHARGLALQIAQVIQLRAANFCRARDLDFLNRR